MAQAVGVTLLFVVEARETTRPSSDALLRGPTSGASAAPLVGPLCSDGPSPTEMVLPGGLPLEEPNGDEIARPRRGPLAQVPRATPLGALGGTRRHPVRTGGRFPYPTEATTLRAGAVATPRPGVAALPPPTTVPSTPGKDHLENGACLPVS